MQKEKQIENDILRWLWSKDVYCWKVKSVGTFDPKKGLFRKPSPFYLKGVSDIIGLLSDGKLFAIEVKTAKGRLSEHQTKFLNNITRCSGLAGVCRSIEDVEKLLGGYLLDRSRSSSITREI